VSGNTLCDFLSLGAQRMLAGVHCPSGQMYKSVAVQADSCVLDVECVEIE